MPRSELHKKQFKKNMAVLLIIASLVVILGAVTYIKMSAL